MKKFAGDIIILLIFTKHHNHVMYVSWNTEWGKHNCPFTTSPPPNPPPPPFPIPHPNDLKNENFEKKWETGLEILSFYTYMCTINENHMIYGLWNIRCDRDKFSSFWAIFCPFSPLMIWKIKILTLKKTPGDIILHICTITDNHMMYGLWDVEKNRHNFLSFWTLFCPFTPLLTQKIKILKKWKINMKILLFYTCVP